MSHKKKRLKGFTLLETMIVVVILGILAALIMPRIIYQRRPAQLAEAMQIIGTVKRSAETHFDLTGGFPVLGIFSDGAGVWGGRFEGNWADLGIDGPQNSKNWSYWYYGDPGGFVVGAYFQTDAATYAYISYDAGVFNDGTVGVGWYCSGIFTNGGDSSKPCLY